MTIRAAIATFAALALLAPRGVAASTDWQAVPSASRLEFVAMYERTPVPGAFRSFDVRARFDPAAPESGALDVKIDVASATLQSADIDAAIAGRDWFDTARFPRAEFRATSIRRVAADRFVASGTLTLKGVAQPLDVTFAWTTVADGATMAGELVVERARFRIGEGEWAGSATIGPRVTVRFRVVLHAER
jgi:polyisoprenoid-binding protein YceI